MKMKTAYQNLWDAVKIILRDNFVVINPYIVWKRKLQINNVTFHLKKLEKEERTKPKVSRRRGIINIGAEINETDTGKTI